MKKHMTDDGPKDCSAQTIETCRARRGDGSKPEHFDNEVEAQKAWEKELEAQHGALGTTSKKEQKQSAAPAAEEHEENGGLDPKEWAVIGKHQAVSLTAQQQNLANNAMKHANGKHPSTDKISRGSRTPWGKADYVQHVAPGIVAVGTPGHGGYKLSAARQRDIPEALRQKGGWYEEDTEEAIVRMYHPDASAKEGTSLVEEQVDAMKKVRDWYPDEYEQVLGVKIEPGESYERDRALWKEKHAQDDVVVSAIYSEKHPGMTEVTTAPGGSHTNHNQTKTYLVPSKEYGNGPNRVEPGFKYRGGFVVDPSRHQEITPAAPKEKPKPKAPAGGYAMNTGNTVTSAQKKRIQKDLNTSYKIRGAQERSFTLREKIEDGSVTTKRMTPDNGVAKYYLMEDSDIGRLGYPVSKATYDAFSGPDERDARTQARDAWRLADQKAEKAARAAMNHRGDAEKHQAWQQAKAKAEAARAAYESTPSEDAE